MNFQKVSDAGMEHLYLSFRARLYYPAQELDTDVRCDVARHLGEIEREMERRNIHHSYLAFAQADAHFAVQR